jgi:hypothetical protein
MAREPAAHHEGRKSASPLRHGEISHRVRFIFREMAFEGKASGVAIAALSVVRREQTPWLA